MSFIDPLDLKGYVDLSMFDRDPSELVERAVLDAVAKLPGWAPREALTEMVLIEGQALLVAELVYAINRLPGAVAEGILRLQGLPRDQGAGPLATVLVTFSDNLDRTITAGTRLLLQLPDNPITFTVSTDTTATGSFTAIAVPVSSAQRTSIANGTPSGTRLLLMDQNFYIDAIELDSAVVSGRDPEDTPTWLSRAVQRLSRLVDTLVLPDHFTAAALEEPGVARATTVNLWNSAGMGAPGDDPGHVTVAVLGPGGVALSGGAKTALYDRLRPMTADHLELHVIDAVVTAVNVTTLVDRDPNFTQAEVEASVAAALGAYLSPDSWPWAGTVYVNELISLIDQVTGVRRVVSVTVPATDFALSGYAPLAQAGTLSVSAP